MIESSFFFFSRPRQYLEGEHLAVVRDICLVEYPSDFEIKRGREPNKTGRAEEASVNLIE